MAEKPRRTIPPDSSAIRAEATRTTQLGRLEWKTPTQRILTAATRVGRLPAKCPPELEPVFKYLQVLGTTEASQLKESTRMPYEQHATLQYATFFPPRVRSLLLSGIRAALLGRLLSGLLSTEEIDPSSSYVCGLFHNIGSLAIDMACYPHDVEKMDALRHHVETGKAMYEAEIEVFGTDYAVVGAELMDHWGAPEWFCDSIRHHNKPSRKSTAYVCMTHLAARLCENETHPNPASTVDGVAYQVLGITPIAVTNFLKVYEGFIPLANLARDIETGRTAIPSFEE